MLVVCRFCVHDQSGNIISFYVLFERPIFKEVMDIYVMQSQSFCEDIIPIDYLSATWLFVFCSQMVKYVTPKGVWSWDWRTSTVLWKSIHYKKKPKKTLICYLDSVGVVITVLAILMSNLGWILVCVPDDCWTRCIWRYSWRWKWPEGPDRSNQYLAEVRSPLPP